MRVEMSTEVENEFYVYLPSNCKDSNKPGDFTVDLPEGNNNLKGKWKVGISEIFYPKFFYNITREMFEDGIQCFTINRLGLVKRQVRLEMQPGLYTAESFCHKMNLSLKRLFENAPTPRLYFHLSAKNISLKMPGGWKLEFKNKRLRYMLGLESEDDVFTIQNKTSDKIFFEFPFLVNFMANRKFTYIYCNIVAYSRVGALFAPILRIVENDLSDSQKEDNHYEFQSPYYYPLIYPNISRIQFTLRDNLGQPYIFPQGETLIVLHFIKKSADDNERQDDEEKW